MNKALFILITLISLNFNSIAQPKACGTDITPEMMEAFYNRDKSHLELKGPKAPVYIPITYHVVSDDNGLGGFSMSKLLSLHCSLVEDYADAAVVFYIHDIIYHQSNYYYNMEDGQAGNTMFIQENIDKTCNVFIVKEAKSGQDVVCGYSYLAAYGGYLNNNGIMLNMDCAGPGSTTLTHEMGHYLNLPHTFSGWEGRDYNLNPISQNQWEKVDGSNCSFRGDGFCDTPPDYISDRWNCFTSPQYTDPNGVTFQTDGKNFMSYSSDECQEYFKPEQQAEVNAAPATYRPYLLSLPTPNLSAVGVSQLVSPSDFENNLSVSNLALSWTEVPGADYYLVQFTQSNFFNIWHEEVVTTNSIVVNELLENKTYRWRVKAFTYGNVCSDYTTQRTFSTASFKTNAVPSSVKCAGESNGSVSVTSENTTINYVWYKFDSVSLNFSFINSGSSNTLNNLSPGHYRVDVTDNNNFQSSSFFNINGAAEIEISIAQVGSSLVPTVTGGTQPLTYTWSNGSASHNNSNPNNGVNTLFITDVNGCFKSEEFTFSPGGLNAINKLGKGEFLILYPNPVSGDILNVKFSSSISDETSFKLISISGNEISKQQQAISIGENIFQINVADLAKGVYFLQFMHNDKMITRKVII